MERSSEVGALVVVEGGKWRSSGRRERNKETDGESHVKYSRLCELFAENHLNISSCAER